MRILGVDPGLSITGYAVLDGDGAGDPTLVEAGAIRPGRGDPLPARLDRLHRDLLEVIREFRPTRMTVEQIFVHRRHVRSSVQMAHARGVILLAAAATGVLVDELSPAEIKKNLAGHGRASKEQMQRAAMAACGLPAPPEPADVADAIAMALCGLRRATNRLGLRLHADLLPRSRPRVELATLLARNRVSPAAIARRGGSFTPPDGSPA